MAADGEYRDAAGVDRQLSAQSSEDRSEPDVVGATAGAYATWVADRALRLQQRHEVGGVRGHPGRHLRPHHRAAAGVRPAAVPASNWGGLDGEQGAGSRGQVLKRTAPRSPLPSPFSLLTSHSQQYPFQPSLIPVDLSNDGVRRDDVRLKPRVAEPVGLYIDIGVKEATYEIEG